MSYPSALEDRIHQRLALGDLEGACRASARLAQALRAAPAVAPGVLLALLHCCLWTVRQSLESLYGNGSGLPRRETLARALAGGSEAEVVDRYERAVDRMIERVRRADARAACPARRARGFVDTNVGRPISTASVARAVACSETHLCVLFREAYGTTVGNYIRRRRIERAKALLAATHLPVKTVAHQSGFATYRTFLRNFRGLTGLSPRRYRRLSQQHGPAATSADGRVSR